MKRYLCARTLFYLGLLFIMSCYVPPQLLPLTDNNIRNVTTVSGNPTNALTWSHTIAPGDNRMLLVSITKRSHVTNTLNNVTYGGMALTKLSEVQGGITDYPRAELWYLLSPPIGTANILATLSSGTDYWQASGMDFIGVNQTTPFGTPVTACSTVENVCATVLSTPNNLVIDVLVYYNGTQYATVNSGQTSRWVRTSDGTWKAAGSTKAGDVSVTMSWVIPSGDWAQIAVSLLPAP